jgi:superoxide dismutase
LVVHTRIFLHLKPTAKKLLKAGVLADVISAQWGSYAAFKEAFWALVNFDFAAANFAT